MTTLLMSITSLIFLVLGTFFTFFELNVLSIFSLLIGGLLYFSSMKNIIGGYNDLSVFFVAFFVLYGISAPVTILAGDDIVPIFAKPYQLKSYLVLFVCSAVSLKIGVITSLAFCRIDDFSKSKVTLAKFNENAYQFINVGLYLCFIAFIFDIINNFRIGFINLFQDKAIYQSMIQELFITLPTSKLYILGVILFSLGFSRISNINRVIKVKLMVITFLILPTVTIHTITGQRGFLLTLAFTLFLSSTYFKSIRKIKNKYFFLCGVFYIGLVLLTVTRGVMGYAIETGDYTLVSERLTDNKEIIRRLNPASNEFGAPFGNMSEYLLNEGELKLGETYLNSFVIIIPSFIYPGEKPTQAIYDFRDRYFPAEAARGSIASTGFSALLEAYMNFRYMGVIFFYFLVGMFLVQIEIVKRTSNNIYFPVFYISLFNLSRSFHRSGFDTVIGELFWATVLFFLTYLLINLARVKRSFNTF